MALSSFCGILTLQVGTAILAVIFIVVAIIAFAENVFDFKDDPHNSFPIPLVLVLVFVALMIIAGVVIFFAAYNESRPLCIVSVVLIVIVMAYWVILACFSFYNNPRDLRRVCVSERCAESFWLINLHYRGDWLKVRGHEEVENGTTTELVTGNASTVSVSPTPTHKRRRRFGDENRFKEDFLEFTTVPTAEDPFIITNQIHDSEKQHSRLKTLQFSDDSEDDIDSGNTDSEEEKHEHDDETPTKYVFGLAMFGAIILFVINFLFFLFCILILWSYAQELRWADFYEEAETNEEN